MDENDVDVTSGRVDVGRDCEREREGGETGEGEKKEERRRPRYVHLLRVATLMSRVYFLYV